VVVRQAALVSDKTKRVRGVYARRAIQIDDLYLHQVELGSADPVQLNGGGYTVDDADWSTTLGLRAHYNDVTVTRNAYETVQYKSAVICSNFKFP